MRLGFVDSALIGGLVRRNDEGNNEAEGIPSAHV
jgi:hypothetical protein